MRAALLVVDLQNDFFERSDVLTASRASITRQTNLLARAFRSAGLPVIWIRQEFAPDLHDAFAEMRAKKISVTISGTSGCQLLPELERRPEDLVLVKKRYSAFFRTGLDAALAKLETQRLVVAGVNTHACVRATVIDAYQRDLDVVVAADAIGSSDLVHHEVTVRYFDDKIARVIPSTEIIPLLAAHAPASTT